MQSSKNPNNYCTFVSHNYDMIKQIIIFII